MVTAIMMIYKNTKAIVRSHYDDTNFFDIIDGALQGYTLEPYLLILFIDYVLQTSIDPRKKKKEKKTFSHFKKGRKQTISYRNYAKCSLRRRLKYIKFGFMAYQP